jgi:hypothetical protein
MFARIVKIRVVSARQAAPGSATRAHSNDNWAISRAVGAPHRTRRPKLACHWRPMIGGRFECYWTIELAGSAATEEAIPSRSKFDANLP